jgi:protoheme IX farnesyltransferase
VIANLVFLREAWWVSQRGQDTAIADGYRAEKRMFGVSIVYLFALFSAFIIDAMLATLIGQPAWPVWY